jgi:hypothetical protein
MENNQHRGQKARAAQMEYHLNREIRYSEDSEYSSLYKWYLQEYTPESQKIGHPLIPWGWSVFFQADDLRYRKHIRLEKEHGIFTDEVNSDKREDNKKVITEEEVIYADLVPGRYMGKLIPDEPIFSMLGTDRQIEKFSLRLRPIDENSGMEDCLIWGCVSYTAEIDFRNELQDDLVEIQVSLKASRFQKLVDAISSGAVDSLSLRIGNVNGFYSEWSPSITTNSVKILTHEKEHKVQVPEGASFIPARLGPVGDCDIYIGKKACLDNVGLIQKTNLNNEDGETVDDLRSLDDGNIESQQQYPKISRGMKTDMTEALANKTVKEWLSGVEAWGGPFPTGNSQAAFMLKKISKLCVAESIRQNDDEDALQERLSNAYEIISTIWREVAPPIATKYWDKDKEQPSEDQKKQIEAARKIIWSRHDAFKSFQEGFESKNHISFDKNSLNSAIADYLACPWLRIAALDWILLDITISGELCAFGEALKRDWLPGPRDKVLGFNNRYYKAKGNLAELKKIDWNYTGERINTWFWSVIGFPLGGIWAAFHFGYQNVGEVLIAIYVFAWLVFISIKVGKFVMQLVRRASGKPDPNVKAFQLWDKMYEVWKLLEGPIVNPTRVREAMQKSADDGAVWDTVSWCLIDKVISKDSAVWFVESGR